ncbi:MAG: MBOAT family protein [Deltaproteobacteria bacterium]|nr:MBOAT family protein [Deltaproteobacteria bacterium]
MTGPAVDIGAPPFWIAFGAAVAVLCPLGSATARRALEAALNLVFIGWLLGQGGVALALVWLLFVKLAVVVLERSPALRAKVFVGSVVVVGLAFVTHKLDDRPSLALAQAWLGAVGFSYVALRTVDVFRSVAEGRSPAPSILDLARYLFPFTMLAAGPIDAWDEFCARPYPPPVLSRDEALQGAERIATGLFKKLVLAELVFGGFLDGFSGNWLEDLVEVQALYLWVYLDFSAYSDIAVGIGRFTGIHAPENFDRPLSARNLIEFWERWHISLSRFIRRNLFLPTQLGLARRSRGAHPLMNASLAYLLAFVLCGLWHGLTLRFLAWGAMHAVALVIVNAYRSALSARLGRIGLKRYMEDARIRFVSRVVTFEFVALSLAMIAPGVTR